MGIPQKAIDRFYLLRQRYDDLRASRLEAYRVWEHERGEVARLEGVLRQRFANVDVRVDKDGTVFFHDYLPGQIRRMGHTLIPDEGRQRTRIVDVDSGTRQAVQLLLTARTRRDRAAAHHQRLNGTGGGLSRLVEECERLLQRRGWSETGASEVRSTAAIGASR